MTLQVLTLLMMLLLANQIKLSVSLPVQLQLPAHQISLLLKLIPITPLIKVSQVMLASKILKKALPQSKLKVLLMMEQPVLRMYVQPLMKQSLIEQPILQHLLLLVMWQPVIKQPMLEHLLLPGQPVIKQPMLDHQLLLWQGQTWK